MAESYSQKPGIYPTLPNVDPVNRDPHGINNHLQLDFAHVIAEPDRSAYNFEILHDVSEKIYRYSKLFIYRLLAVLVGIPLVLIWGLIFGIYSFFMIWIATPSRRLAQSLIGEMGIYVQTVSDAAIGPLYRSMGQMWSNVRVSLSKHQTNQPNQSQV